VAGALRERLGGGGADDGDWGAPGGGDDRPPPVEVEPDYGLSGVLAAETNTVSGVTLLHSEPPEARMPTKKWRLYVFKGEAEAQPPLMLHTQSSFLVGRERKVATIATDHPSCSKQHAVLQWRLTEKDSADGMRRAAVRLYCMDLGSTNGTFLNGERLEAQKYVELLHQDALRFGNSSREYVLIADDAARKP
jgi:smad nuclear-interacting protein 1